jgi:hypothetical protein
MNEKPRLTLQLVARLGGIQGVNLLAYRHGRWRVVGDAQLTVDEAVWLHDLLAKEEQEL